MNSLGALLLVVSLRVIICQHEREPPGRKSRQGPPMSSINDEAFAVGSIYVNGIHMEGSNKIYLPLHSEYNGVLHSVEAFFMSTEPVYLQIWRPQSSSSYKLISQFQVQSEKANVTKTIIAALTKNSRCPIIHAGDRLGVFSLGQKTPIAVIQDTDGNIPIASRTSRIVNDEVVEFQNVDFPHQFSLKFFIHQDPRINQYSGPQRYGPCPQEEVTTSPTSTAAVTKPRKTTTTTTTTTTTPNIKEMAGVSSGVPRRALTLTIGVNPTNVPGKGVSRQGMSRSSKMMSTKHPMSGSTPTYSDVSGQEPPRGATVARVPVVTSTREGGKVLPKTDGSKNKNVLTIAIAALAGVALIAITTAVGLAAHRRCAKRPRRRLARCHQDSATIPIDVPTPTTPNPAYGISCDFLNPYSSPSCRRTSDSTTHDYRPVIPDRPMAGFWSRPVAVYEDSPGKPRGNNGNPKRTTPVDHTYLDLVSDDVDSGVGDSDNGGSRPSSGATDSSS